MGKEFINGLRLALNDIDYELFIESIGFGSDPKQLLNSYQKLSFQNDVTLTTGLLGHFGYADLANFASQNGDVLIAADLGGKKPFRTPNGVFQNSLGLYDSLGALVRYFDSQSVKTIAPSTSYYESGYDFVESLATAIDHTENISFSGHFITPLHPRENESELMAQTMESIKPDAIVAFHNAIYAKEHAEFLNENKVHENYPIYALPFSCPSDLAESFPEVFEKIKIISSWYTELENDANKKFVEDYEKKHAKSPGFFALLGYENGLVINEALRESGKTLTKKIKEIEVKGPRGPISFNEELNRTSFPNFLWKIDKNAQNKTTRKILDKLDSPLNLTQNNQSEQEQAGWYNAYLCH